ncbi:hypothetical protein GCM10007874_33520 [Labrys miyagiensis]|uniref:ATP-grasp domain-containing protein n=1 Tax=Labrys miyagiensis TaxID=346912 RepID=A0ABQ6CN59_9HYPH|nr:hypothetical protein [Labrys miyagiensis]GLS20335.1 hypothetical protein GCM10007874_33520 [Labrys miyagiensis]
MSQTRNLVLVHSEGWQDIADMETIKKHVEEAAPDIEVFIASNTARLSYTRKKAAGRPCLIFSPISLLTFQPNRGKVYSGQPMSKLIEMQRLASAGIPVPHFEEIRPDTVLSPDFYGPLVIIKPSYALASWGVGIELVPTAGVRYKAPSEYLDEHPGRRGPMVAQRFIDCGYAMTCRVLTLFGAPLFTYCRESTKPLVLESRHGPFNPRDFMPAPPDSIAYSTREPDILALAAAAYEAMPDVALQACDILRSKTGELYLLEVNPGGGTWMFSSKNAAGYRERLGVEDLATEFDAFRTCARVLIERTRAEAI